MLPRDDGQSNGVTHVPPSPLANATAFERKPTAPGLVLNVVAIALFSVALWRGSERGGDLGSILLIATAWFILLLWWLFWAVAAAGAGRIGTNHMGRWILAPSLFALAAALVFGGYALQARFRLSEGALEAAADAAAAGRMLEPGLIGLYPVEAIAVSGTNVRFSLAGDNTIVRGNPVERGRTWNEPLGDGWWWEVEVSGWFFD